MKATNNRIPISSDMSAEVMFLSDSTCCVCNERGKVVQIHHIDENPNNNTFQNLAVLCLQCHNDTQINGGFGRKLTADLVSKYRNDWQKRVKYRRDESDSIAISKSAKISEVLTKKESVLYLDERSNAILEYVNFLPTLRKELKQVAKLGWDTGTTSKMVDASYHYIDSLQGILFTLSKFYPQDTFDSDSHKFFSEYIASSFKWHRAHMEPDGPGTGGTIINVQCCNNVIGDIEKMIHDISFSLVGFDDRFNWKEWPKLWNTI